ncbi:MAG: DUF6268 family outer membrane beta-barrel protein [Marinoscillum sp.]
MSYRYGPAQSMENGLGSATEQVLFLNAKLPIVLNQQNIWYNDLTYQGSYVNYSDDVTTEPAIGLHQFILQTGWVRKLNEDQAFQVLLVPRLMSDLEHIDGDHFQFGGIGLYEQRFSDNLLMRFGGMFNTDRFGPMFVPLIYADWNISTKWFLIGLVPIYSKIGYRMTERMTIGVSQFGLITSFQMGDPAFNDDYIERKSIDLSVFVRYQVTGNIYLEPRVGYAVGRSYRQFNSGDQVDYRIAILTVGDSRTQQNTSFDPGIIFDLRFVYNLPVPD